MTALATVADLEVRLRLDAGSIAGSDRAAAAAAIEDASALVAAEAAAAGLAAAWTPADVPRAVRRVVIAVALRQYDNPDGYISENFAGAYSYARSLDAVSPYLLAAEQRLIRGAVEAIRPAPRCVTGTVRVRSASSSTPSRPADTEAGRVPA